LQETVKDYFEAMPSQFNSDKAAGMTATYQFDITGEGRRQVVCQDRERRVDHR
jgi:hypothetical protein